MALQSAARSAIRSAAEVGATVGAGRAETREGPRIRPVPPSPPPRAGPTAIERSLLNVDAHLRNILGEILGLGERADRLTDDSPLLGSLPELDSMAVVSVITTVEEHFGIAIGDDEISAQTFATFGSLRRFVEDKLKD